ncbi:hypothetical protein Acor_21400 [Acrocarpospora corrugata]|uniref:Uncharacterized protein n=1 Tax=Acrocarpospora corrugata TaxID=35763 RepID=A0A5M3VTE8_9ACTN|nr:hypothetical protein [Acrocarpospora corrugata]GES00077.1 hypothetical protein Acor_21400 [Acrocarpospora corrugata]
MDPTVLVALISAVLGGAAGEAGKGAWTSLTSLVRQRFGKDSAELAVLDSESAPEITAVLTERAQSDAGFDEELTSWAATTTRVIQQSHNVSNTISGNARIQGTVIQAGDLFGPINLNG